MSSESKSELCNSCTYTITFSEMVENHVGMEKIGSVVANGYTVDDLRRSYKKFKDAGADVKLVNLRDVCKLPEIYEVEDAYLLIVSNGCEILGVNSEELYAEQSLLNYDTKALMRGRVVNKKARHNLCFADHSSDCDFEKGKGTIISFEDVKLLEKLRENIPNFIPRSKKLFAEGNKYYDVSKCYIGFHGDAERKKVIGVRIGADFDLHYRYYLKGEIISDTFTTTIKSGTVYVMSEKTTGNDWKKRNTVTLRHAAGLLKNVS